MSLSISSVSSLLKPAASLLNKKANPLLDAVTNATAATAAADPKATAGTTNAKQSTNDSSSASDRTSPTAKKEAKHEIRREVADGGSIKITVISYSDGSVDKQTEIKGGSGGDFLKAFGIKNIDPTRAPSLEKGMLVDRTA